MSCYYVGLDVHKASICVAVLNAAGKLTMESVVETSAARWFGASRLRRTSYSARS